MIAVEIEVAVRAAARASLRWPAIILTAAVLTACGRGDTSPSPTAITTATVVSGPADNPTPTPTPAPEPSPYRFLYREFGQEADIIWRVNPSDPSQREQIAAVPHPPGWGITPSLSPDGKSMVYTVLPTATANPLGQAEAYLMDLTSKETKPVAKAVDLNLRPLWSLDGQLIYFGSHDRQDVLIIQVELARPPEDPERERVILRNNVATFLSLTPIGFSREEGDNVGKERMYLAQVHGGTAGGTSIATYDAPVSLAAITTATAVATAATPPPDPNAPPPEPPPPPPPRPTPTTTFVVQISDQIARDCSLSPDAKKVACLVPGLVDGQFLARAVVADLPGRRVDPLSAEGLAGGDHLRPLWHPDDDTISLGQLPSTGKPGAVAIVPVAGGEPTFLTPPSLGFDVPLSWAPDGRFLAVTSFPGDSLANPGPPSLVFLSPGGQRVLAAEAVEVEPLGWMKPEG